MNLIKIKDLDNKYVHFSDVKLSKIQADFV